MWAWRPGSERGVGEGGRGPAERRCDLAEGETNTWRLPYYCVTHSNGPKDDGYVIFACWTKFGCGIISFKFISLQCFFKAFSVKICDPVTLPFTTNEWASIEVAMVPTYLPTYLLPVVQEFTCNMTPQLSRCTLNNQQQVSMNARGGVAFPTPLGCTHIHLKMHPQLAHVWA